ncbi:hypothetical protein KY284_031672 [Solanum tuberosum]|nr:hypothetical protein KY284_031672 [Solanum tuberosum]
MVVEVNYKLRNWWIDIKIDREREIRQLLGGLTYLIFVITNPHLIRALLEFWDPMRMIFKFVDFDLAPTIEEISGFINLPYHDCEMLVLYKPSSKEFRKSLGMKSNLTLPYLDLGELEEEVTDMRGWAKLLLSVDPTLERNIDTPHVTSQATLQDNPPPTHPTSHPPPTYPTSQNQPSSIQMPPKNTHFPNYPYPPQYHAYASRPPYLTPRLSSPTLQAPQYQISLHQVPCEIWMNTRARWIESFKVCAYHSGMKGHTIEECRDLKDKIQQLIDTKIICLEYFAPTESK